MDGNGEGGARKRQSQPGAEVPGVISIHEVYTLAEAKRRLGFTEAALRAAKRRGLVLLPCGKRKFVAGAEIIRFLQAQNPS